MHIILDFDYTLFNTNCLRQKMMARVLEFGVGELEYTDAERILKDRGELYTLEKHIEGMVKGKGELREEVLHALEQVISNLRDCVYPDALEFLTKMKKKANDRIIIFSYGATGWQERKIAGSGLVNWVDEVVVVEEPKEIALKSLKCMSENDILFVSDRGTEIDSVRQRYPKMRCIWLSRADSPYCLERPRSHALTISLLTEISLEINNINL